jgi:hypothetical protein
VAGVLLQSSLQTPPAQRPGQAFAHDPQWFLSVAPLTSQPSLARPLQSRNPLWQVPVSQTPPLQTGVLLFTVHAVPHTPQFWVSLPRLAQ